METLLPTFASVVETCLDSLRPSSFEDERAAVVHAVEERRREHTTVRECAREAMARFGVAPCAIPSGPQRQPVWPDGIVGSLTHCKGYRAAAVARSHEALALGIDAEPHLPLSTGVLALVTRPEERARLATAREHYPAVHWGSVLFSAKESVFKAWFPVTGCWLDFSEASITFGDTGSFEASIIGRTDTPPELATFRGRWRVRDGLVLTAVAVSRRLWP